MIEYWIQKIDCTGCGTCQNICPTSAITMVPDDSGFIYPEISNAKCIDCGKCATVCPVNNKIRTDKKNPIIYSAWSKDPQIRYKSTSGGLFSEIAIEVLKKGGIVFGAEYNFQNLIQHTSVDNITELDKLRQSKYAQSNIGLCLKAVKQTLENNIPVVFCGTPCQIAGLHSFLGKNYENLLTIDFVCRGVNSPKALKHWLMQRESEFQNRIIRVWFKYKQNGWHKSPRCTRLECSNGKVHVLQGKCNTFMSGYLGPNLYIRPSCGNCLFKGLPRFSDITLADFWAVDKEYDDDQGTSLVMLNSDQGILMFNSIKENIVFNSHHISAMYAGNPSITESVKIHPKSKEFLLSLDKMPFDQALVKYSKVSIFNRVINKIGIWSSTKKKTRRK